MKNLIIEYAAGIGYLVVAVIIFNSVIGANSADEKSAGFHGGIKLFGEAAGRIGISAFFAAGAGACAHSEEILALFAKKVCEKLKMLFVFLGNFHHGLEIIGVLAVANSRENKAFAEVAAALFPIVKLATGGRTGPGFAIAHASVGSAHAANIAEKLQCGHLKLFSGGETAFKGECAKVGHRISSHSSNIMASTYLLLKRAEELSSS